MPVVPPGANGTTILTGLFGQAPWARAEFATNNAANKPASTRAGTRRTPSLLAMAQSANLPGRLESPGLSLAISAATKALWAFGLHALVGHHHRAQGVLALQELGVFQGGLHGLVELS
jgi:hypothetical protein